MVVRGTPFGVDVCPAASGRHACWYVVRWAVRTSDWIRVSPALGSRAAAFAFARSLHARGAAGVAL